MRYWLGNFKPGDTELDMSLIKNEQVQRKNLHHCNPVQGSTGASQGNPCNENRIPATRTGNGFVVIFLNCNNEITWKIKKFGSQKLWKIPLNLCNFRKKVYLKLETPPRRVSVQKSKAHQGWRKRGGRGGRTPPDFGRIEGAAGQRRRTTLLLTHPDFQTLRHPCDKSSKLLERQIWCRDVILKVGF